MEELLSLKWNNHKTTFIHVLGTLREKNLYTDAVIACDGKFYNVHKLVLSTCSDYFSAMLDRTNCKNPVIVLKDIKCEDLEALLDYMYVGEVNVRQCDLATLIKAAECLRVKGLAVPEDEPPPPQRKNRDRRDSSLSSPPAKRKRRTEVEDVRENIRNYKREVVDNEPILFNSTPKTSSINSIVKSTNEKNVSNNNSSDFNSFDVVEILPIQLQSDKKLENKIYNKEDNNTSVEQIEPDSVNIKAEVIDDSDNNGDSNNVEDVDDSYMNNEDFKEDPQDLSSDLPEFLQQASNNFPQSSYNDASFQSVSRSIVGSQILFLCVLKILHFETFK